MQPNYREGFSNQRQTSNSPYEYANYKNGTNNINEYSYVPNSASIANNQNVHEPYKTKDNLEINDRNRNKPMYSSTIQFSQPKQGLSLESMGRLVQQSSKANKVKNDNFSIDHNRNNGHLNQFMNYADSRQNEKRMSSSSFFNTNDQNSNNMNSFLEFQLKATNNGVKTNQIDNRITNMEKTESNDLKTNQTQTEKRRRQILEIKKQLDEINKKIDTNKTSNQNNKNQMNLIKQNNSIASQSSILTNGTNNFQTDKYKMDVDPSIINEGSQTSLLDKLYEQKKAQQQYQQQSSFKVEKIEKPTNKIEPNINVMKMNENIFTNPISKVNQNINQKHQEINVTEDIKQEQIQQQGSKQISFKKKKDIFVQDTLSPKNNFNYQKSVIKRKTSINGSIPTEEDKIKTLEPKAFKKDDFEIGKKMGKGQFGEVLLVKHKLTGFICGMKVMQKKQIREQNYVGQIARELSIQFYLSHRNVAALYGYFQDEKNVYLLIQFCEGGQLLEKLRGERRMKERDVSQIMKQVCEGVDYIHKEQIIHRDIKPENILFNHGVVKISDFGWAVYRGFGMRKTASGSPLYYPPEIVKGEEYDDKIDIWNIGMMTYECILGKIPFRIYTEMDLDRIVSDEITFPEYVDVEDDAKDFILKSMKKKGDERIELRKMLRHPFIVKQQDYKLSSEIIQEFKRVLN